MNNLQGNIRKMPVENLFPPALAFSLRQRGISTLEEFLAVHGNDTQTWAKKYVGEILTKFPESKRLLPKYEYIPSYSFGLKMTEPIASLISVDPGLVLPTRPVPDEFDLSERYKWEIKNQGSHPICVAEATNSALEYLVRRWPISPVGTYRAGQQATGRNPDDSGLPLDGGLRGIKQFGIMKNTEWKFEKDSQLPYWPPDKTTLRRAKRRQLHEWHGLKARKDNLQRVLVYGGNGEGRPIFMGLKVYRRAWFNPITKNRGVVFEPDENDEHVGNHAMLMVGYDTDRAKFLNSWGEYGDNGFLYISFNYIAKFGLSLALYTAKPTIESAVGLPKRKTIVAVASAVALGLGIGAGNPGLNKPAQEVSRTINSIVKNSQSPLSASLKDRKIPNGTKTIPRLTSIFGNRLNPFDKNRSEFHRGVDIGLAAGAFVNPISDGTVKYAGWGDSRIGKCVVISHNGRVESIYGHLSDVYVAKGQKVTRKHTIGAVGQSGRASGPHLHLGLKDRGRFLDPLKFNYDQLAGLDSEDGSSKLPGDDEVLSQLRRVLFLNMNEIIKGGNK